MNWEDICKQLGLSPEEVLAESQWSFVFRQGGTIHKLINKNPNTSSCHPLRIKVSGAEESQSLYKLYNSCQVRVPTPLGFWDCGSVYYITTSIVGEEGFQRWTPKIAFSYAEQLYMLNQMGVQHNDASKGNLRLDRYGEVWLVDFDQCRPAENANDFVNGRCYPAKDILGEEGFMNLKEMQDRLSEAWQIARRSQASAPGELTAYYRLNTFEHAGMSPPESWSLAGERDWEARWAQIRPALLKACGGTLEGKRILELGHNMGLLSIWAAREGAICTAVEREADIQEASRIIADVFEVSGRCTWVNEDLNRWQPTGWVLEENFDVITCCRLMYHVHNKQNLIKAMGWGKALLYEGHDSKDVETQRINQAGYPNVEVIYRTERNTDLLLGTK
jgi:hypothetical protein